MNTYPAIKPITICKYVKSADPTMPGTEMNVTPLKEAPTMPNATTYQGAFRPAKKKSEDFLFRPVK